MSENFLATKKQKKNKIECRICLTPTNAIFVSTCGHITCLNCDHKFDICPFCRTARGNDNIIELRHNFNKCNSCHTRLNSKRISSNCGLMFCENCFDNSFHTDKTANKDSKLLIWCSYCKSNSDAKKLYLC